MPLFTAVTLVGGIALVGTSGLAGTTALTRRRKQPPAWLLEEPTTEQLALPPVSSEQALVQHAWTQARRFGDSFHAFSQMFAEHTIDPLLDGLFGADRDQHFIALGANTDAPRTISADEQRANQRITLGTITLVSSGIGLLVFPPLYMARIPLAIALAVPEVYLAASGLLRERRLSVRVLFLLFVGGCFLKGYFLAIAVGSIVMATGNKVLYKTIAESTSRVSNVFGQQPRTVHVLINNVCQEIPFESLQAQDIVLVRAGQPVPADGTIVSGMATIDQHMLTGEAQPVEKQVGDTVLAPTLVLAGEMHVRVEKTGSETVAAQIMQTLTSIANYRTENDLRSRRLVDALVLPTLLGGALAWAIVGSTGAVAILGVGNIFLLRIINPIAMLNFLNIAAQHGILVKDARTLDQLSSIDMIVFDKTGTLTLEQPHVVAVHTCAGFNEQTVLAYAAASEQHQTHPIARAILHEAADRRITLPTSDHVRYELGYGLRVTIGDTLVRVGSLRFLQQEGIVIPPDIQELQQRCHAAGHSLVLVSLSAYLAGAIELQPTVRPEAPAVIKALQQRGLTVAILSGDQEEPTRVLAGQLGMDSYFANTLPTQKAALIQHLQAQGRKVCFVGDGINDAIALKQADVSISIRGATSIATDTAQVVLMNQDLSQILDLLNLSRKVDNNLKASIISLTLPDVIFIGGVFLLNWGVYGAFITFIVSLFGSVGTAMVPLFEQRWNEGRQADGKEDDTCSGIGH